MFQGHIISLTIWVPIVFGIAVLAIGSDRNPAPARWTALAGSVLGFLVCLPLWSGFEHTADMQFVEMSPWITSFNVSYHLGVDGISMPLILLNSLMTVLVVIAHWEVVKDKVAQYLAAFLLMSGFINGTFAALDAILFYVFFEAMLIPMFLIIGVWGGPNRVYAAVKFFMYTLLGSLLMLASFIYLYYQTNGSFEILDFHRLALPMGPQVLIFLAMFMSFAVKVPMWPVHTWLPDAHVEAPTGGSVILAAITLKIGGYGFLRFNLPIAPDASHALAGFMIALSLIAIVYIGLVALVQADMKKLIAYSSISHMGFVTLGFFIFNADGMLGGLIQ
ncbi:MAG TPA: NADH-quinone oxidoreductase subunit M, partial [Usitatibacter sp.]|nr:NADH-quinone oxidoreductase subunit M [Usitatibacter sp.]